MARYPCSTLILAGGSAAPHLLEAFWTAHGDDTMLVTDDPLRHLEFSGLILAGIRQRPYPTGAICKGLAVAIHAHVLVVDGRQPLPSPGLLNGLLDAVEPRWDLVIPVTSSGRIPRLAVFAKRCLKPLARLLGRNRSGAAALCSELNTLVIPAASGGQGD